MHNPSVLFWHGAFFHIIIYRNNADLGKGVPRQHVFHEAWELLFSLLYHESRDKSRSALPTPISRRIAVGDHSCSRDEPTQICEHAPDSKIWQVY